jgi:hypothetical protein
MTIEGRITISICRALAMRIHFTNRHSFIAGVLMELEDCFTGDRDVAFRTLTDRSCRQAERPG